MRRFERQHFAMTASVVLAAFCAFWIVKSLFLSAQSPDRSVNHRSSEFETSRKDVPGSAQYVSLASPDLAQRIGIETFSVRKQKIARYLEANAEAAYNGQRTAEIFARVTGVVREVHVDLNQSVKRGDVLATIDSASVGSAKAQLLTAVATVKLAEATYERFRALTEKQIAAAKNELEALTVLTQARTSLTEAKQRLFSFGFTDEDLSRFVRDNAADNHFELVAPLDGHVTAWDAISGEAVEPTTQLFVVSDTSSMWLWIDAYESEIAELKIGQSLTFSISGSGAPSLPGCITAIGTEVNRKTRTTRVRALLKNPDGRLRANQFGRARIQEAEEHDALVLPAGAVQHDGETTIVFVCERAGRYRRQPVVVLPISEKGMVEIAKGVEPGQEVVTTGAFLLYSELVKDRIAEDVD